MSMTRNDLRLGSRLVIGSADGDVVIELEQKSGQLARLKVDAPPTVTVKLEASRGHPLQESRDSRIPTKSSDGA